MKYSLLSRTHADAQLGALQRHQDLFDGGDGFRARVATYLPRHDMEPTAVHQKRCASAHYLNYVARIVRFFAAALFKCPVTPKSEPEPDAWYGAFAEDADGTGTDLAAVLQEAFTRSLVGGRAYVRLEIPARADDEAPASLADADALGLRDVRVCAVPTEAVRHWKRAADGSFDWVLEHQRVEELEDIDAAAPVITETWTAWYRDGSTRRWQVAYTAATKPAADSDIPEGEPPDNPFGAIPLVELRLPTELHLVAQVASAQLEHFRKRNALSWAVDRTCYAMPWFFLKNAKKPPTMGVGYYGILEVTEKVEWPAPPPAPFAVVSDLVRDLVQEMHRVVEQMALAVDNNAAAAVGRSGESKGQDADATRLVLPAFGLHVREFCERIYELVSVGRGDGLAWSVEGMDRYDSIDAAGLTDMALASEPIPVPSPTYKRELYKALVHAQLPHLRDDLRTKIDAEIDAGVNAEDTRREPPVTDPKTKPGSGMEDDDGDA